MRLERLESNMTIKNYKELCEILEIEQLKNYEKNRQLRELQKYFAYEKKGLSFIIMKVHEVKVKSSYSNSKVISKKILNNFRNLLIKRNDKTLLYFYDNNVLNKCV